MICLLALVPFLVQLQNPLRAINALRLALLAHLDADVVRGAYLSALAWATRIQETFE